MLLRYVIAPLRGRHEVLCFLWNFSSTLFGGQPHYKTASGIHVCLYAQPLPVYCCCAYWCMLVTHPSASLGPLGFCPADACCQCSFRAKWGKVCTEKENMSPENPAPGPCAGSMPSLGNNLFIDKWLTCDGAEYFISSSGKEIN